MRYHHLVLYIVLLAVFVMAIQPSVDTDTWWHLRSGAWILENGQILKSDPFSLTRQGQAWVYPGWISQIILFIVYDLFGFAGLNLLTGLMVLIAFAILWTIMEGKDLLRAFVLILAAAASGLYWSARPQIFTFVFASVCLFLLEGSKRGRLKRLWILPFLIMLWTNTHGGFIVGFMLIGIYFLGEVIEALISVILGEAKLEEEWQNRKDFLSMLSAVGVASIFAGMVNPHGPAILLYPFKTVSMGILRDYIVEWQSPDFHTPEVQPFILLLFLTFLALGISKKRRSAHELLLVIIFGYMSLIAARNIGLFALVAAPSACRHLEAGLQPLFARTKSQKELPEKLIKGINLILAILLTVAGLIRAVSQLDAKLNQEQLHQQIPLEAFQYIKEEWPEGELFNSYNWGGYVLWKLYPHYLSFVDGRTDLFSDELLNEYLDTWMAQDGWQAFLEDWGIDWALLEIESPLSNAMISEGWKILYQDEKAIILKRNRSEP